MMIGYFWGYWGMFYGITEIGLLEFMLGPFISTTSLYLISVFLPIPRLKENSTDIDNYYLEGRKPFFIVMAIFFIQSQLTAFYSPNTTPELLVLLFVLVFVAVLVVLLVLELVLELVLVLVEVFVLVLLLVLVLVLVAVEVFVLVLLLVLVLVLVPVEVFVLVLLLVLLF